MLDILVSSIVQLIVFSIIPFIWWFLTARDKESYFQWIGLKKPLFKIGLTKLIIMIVIISIGIIASISIIMTYFSLDADSATNQFYQKGWAALPNIVIYALIQTSLSEEILFRGFIGKRLMNKFGFLTGNTIQALLFGLIHGIPFGLLAGNFMVVILLTLLAGMMGWMNGYVNEKYASGSIVPSWAIHAILNILSGLASAL